MDIAALAVGLLAQQTQSQIGTAVLKQQLNSQAQVLQLLQPPSQANLGPGVGGNVDISA